MHDVVLELRQPEHVVLLFGPFDRVPRLGGNLLAGGILLQLCLGEKGLVGHAVPTAVLFFVDRVVGAEDILKVTTNITII